MKSFALSTLLALSLVSSASAKTVSDIKLGYAHTCAVVDGALECWGWNQYGQLGNGTNFDSAVPKPVPGLGSGVTAIAAGNSHTCAIQNGAVFCWGTGTFGRIGDGTQAGSPSPRAVALPAGKTATSIAAGNAHTCAVVDGGVMCWGWNRNCQLGKSGCTGGEENKYDMELTPRWVDNLGPGSGATSVSAGYAHTCAIVQGGVKCWGAATLGRLGDGRKWIGNQDLPVDVQGLGPNSGVTQVAAGDWHTCAIARGAVKCWGFKQTIGRNPVNTDHAYSPIPVSGMTNASFLSTSDNTTCVSSSGSIFCWGANGSGQIGNGETKVSYTPSKVIKLGGMPGMVASGPSQNCAVVGAGLKCWGWNDFCQLGAENCADHASIVPTPVNVVGY